MAKEHKILKGILIAMLSLFLVLNLNLIVFSSMISSTVLNPEFYIQEMEAANFYASIREQAIAAYAAQMPPGYPGMQSTIENALTEEWIKTQINSMVRNFFAYINSQTDELSLKISTADLKKKSEIPVPIPDEIDFVKISETGEMADFKSDMAQVRDFVSYLHTSFYLLVLSAIIIAAIIALLLKKPEKILRFLGIDMFICGSALFFLRPMVLGMVSNKFTDAQMPSFLSKEILLKILNDIFQPVNDWSIAFMVLGIVLVVASFIIKKEEEEKEIKTEVEEELKEVKEEEFKK